MGRTPYLFSQKTINEMLEYRKAGFTFREIFEIVGSNEKSVKNWFARNYSREERMAMVKNNPKIHFIDSKEEKKQSTTTNNTTEMNSIQNQPVSVQPKEKTLKDFQARDIIKYLYKLGYRIENNKLVFIQKVPVLIEDILNS